MGTKVVTPYGNFAKGKIDHDMMGRFDLPIYGTGVDELENFITNFKGNAIFSAGFLSKIAFQDCEFIEFKFGTNQNYLCVFYANKIRFLAFDTNGTFGWVLDAGLNILEVATPYTLAQAHELDYTQNNDVMVVTHPLFEPRKLIRVSSNSFTFNTFARLSDPFPTTYAAPVNITNITQAAVPTVTAAGHGLATGDRTLITGVVGMTQINNYTVTVTVLTINTFTIDINTTSFTAYGSAGTSRKVTAGDYPACCLFYKGRLFYAATPLKGTKVWFSTSAVYDDFTVPTTLTDSSAFNFVIADIAQKIDWLFPGDNSLIAGAADGIAPINGGGVNTAITASTVQANVSSAEPTNGVYPIKKDGYIFYVGQNNRNVYYFKYDLISESFLSDDANILSYDITKSGLNKLRFKKDRNDLIFALRNDGDLISCNFKKSENINGWHERFTEGVFHDIGVIGDNTGAPQLFALVERNGTYYIEQQASYVEFARQAQFFTDDADQDKEAYTRYVAEQLRDCVHLDGSMTYEDLRSTTITFTPLTFNSDGTPATGTIVASGASFTAPDVGKHIAYRTLTGYESGRFEITAYTNNTTVSVDVLQQPKFGNDTPLYVYSSWYKSFSSISGISQYNGTTVSLVTDGGYLDDYTISGGAQALPSQTCSIVIGYKYRGLIKTFPMGFQFQGSNTQITLKEIDQVGVRVVSSAGGKIGTSQYELEKVQELGQNDLNYLPPIPIDGTKMVDYTDDAELDKCLYIVQDEPLPFHIACIMAEGSYVRNT